MARITNSYLIHLDNDRDRREPRISDYAATQPCSDSGFYTFTGFRVRVVLALSVFQWLRHCRRLHGVHAFSLASDPVISQTNQPAEPTAARRAFEMWLLVYDHVLDHVAGLFEAPAALRTTVSPIVRRSEVNSLETVNGNLAKVDTHSTAAYTL